MVLDEPSCEKESPRSAPASPAAKSPAGTGRRRDIELTAPEVAPLWMLSRVSDSSTETVPLRAPT